MTVVITFVHAYVIVRGIMCIATLWDVARVLRVKKSSATVVRGGRYAVRC